MATKDDTPQIRHNAVGFILMLRVGANVLNETTDIDLVLKDDERREVKHLTADNITNRTTGEISYTMATGDLSVVGNYQVQVIDVSDGVFLPSDIEKFKVVENL